VVTQKTVIHQGFVALLCLVFAATASAAVTARVDRPEVDLNESFTLEIIVDASVDTDPDLTVLDDKFYRGQVSRLQNSSIYNGQINRSTSWTVTLMPKFTGTQEIPPIPLGADLTNPVMIKVNEPENAPPGEADVFVTSEVDVDETFVQAQILYSIKVYRAVATRQPALREPTISGAEVLVEPAGEERSYEAVLNGKAYNVVERVIALYPQESGEISISPALFEARVLRDGRITGRKVFQSEAQTVKVLPIPAPPADHPNASWLPARDVQLSEEWSRDPAELKAGEPITRNITISALGQIETQIPALELPEVDGLNVYTDKPELGRVMEAGGIRGIRSDQYAIIGVNGGEIELPAVELPWWDIEAGEWRVARLPATTLEIAAGASQRVVPPETPATEAAVAESAEQATPAEQPLPSLLPDSAWKRISQLLAALWLVTVFAWWWFSRDTKREVRQPEPPPIYKQQDKLLKAARKAARDGDAAGVRSALIEWGRLQWPDAPPRSVGDVATRVSSPLADELNKLSAASYGPGSAEWDAEQLAKLLRSIEVRPRREDIAAKELLPPLMPPAA
jgi:hypothetical protein